VADLEGEEAFKLIRQWGLALVRRSGARVLLVAVVGFGCCGATFVVVGLAYHSQR
jgi:hypothetical protein